LSCADFPLALALTRCHTPLRVCRVRRQELGNLPLTLATSITGFDVLMRIHRDLYHLSEASAGRAHLTMDARQQARLGFDTALAPMVPASGEVWLPLSLHSPCTTTHSFHHCL
jgi:hypothetical protein